MEVKEAIEVCKCILNWPSSTMRTTEENIGDLREVISLLRQGEAYRQIVESIEWHINTCKEVDPEVYGWLKFIERTINKYFPKEAKSNGS